MSQLVAWKDSFAIDDGLIDADHKYLISLINDVLVAMRDGRDQDEIRRMIGRLRCFARLHFDREEILQSVAGFEERGFHARRHNELMIQLDEAFKILAEEEPADRRGRSERRRSRSARMKTLFYGWLHAHIVREDIKMRPLVPRMRGIWSRFPPLDGTGPDLARAAG